MENMFLLMRLSQNTAAHCSSSLDDCARVPHHTNRRPRAVAVPGSTGRDKSDWSALNLIDGRFVQLPSTIFFEQAFLFQSLSMCSLMDTSDKCCIWHTKLAKIVHKNQNCDWAQNKTQEEVREMQKVNKTWKSRGKKKA